MKLTGPHQNFLYVVQSYDLPGGVLLEEAAARIVPWTEFFLGVFLVLGLWLKCVLRALAIFIAMLMLVVGQALLRGLPLTECGCFGGFVSFSPRGILMFDGALLFLAAVLARREKRAAVFSLDRYFST